MKKKIDKDLQLMLDFFTNYVKIGGELQLYKTLFGEMPFTKEGAIDIMKTREMYRNARPLSDALQKHINSLTPKVKKEK